MATAKDTAATATTTSRCPHIVYTCLLLVRFLCVLLPGYIHPDEFYQGGQELFFGVPPSPALAALYPKGFSGTWSWTSEDSDGRARGHSIVPTWEFEPQNAIRSIVPPLFMTVLPLKVYVAVRRLLHTLLLSAQMPSNLLLTSSFVIYPCQFRKIGTVVEDLNVLVTLLFTISKLINLK